ncbi:MAG: ATP-binding protein [Planctomycetota bacterium]
MVKRPHPPTADRDDLSRDRADFTVEADGSLQAMGRAASALHDWLNARQLEAQVRYAVELSFDELVGNAIRHADPERASPRVRFAVDVEDGHVGVVIEDDGAPFDPTRQPSPPAPTSLADAPPGGRGIAMVRKVARRFDYRRVDGRNRITLEIARGSLPRA